METNLRVKTLGRPRQVDTLNSLAGQNLHPSLVNFYFAASENYTSYLSNKDPELQPV